MGTGVQIGTREQCNSVLTTFHLLSNYQEKPLALMLTQMHVTMVTK